MATRRVTVMCTGSRCWQDCCASDRLIDVPEGYLAVNFLWDCGNVEIQLPYVEGTQPHIGDLFEWDGDDLYASECTVEQFLDNMPWCYWKSVLIAGRMKEL